MILPIVKAPNKVLMTKTRNVTKFDAKLDKLLKDMRDTLLATKDPEGVGLAANQVGVSLSVFIIRPDKNSKITEFINPAIKERGKVKIPSKKELKKSTTLEGCLSLEKIWSPIYRPQSILVEYQDRLGQKHEVWFSDFEAVIIQHELDHLDGILFTTRALEQGSKVYEEVGEDFNEIALS